MEHDRYPSPYYDCFESSIMNIILCMGLPNELFLMSTHTYLVWDYDKNTLYPRIYSLQYEWQRIHGLELKSIPVVDEITFRQQLVNKLNSGIPVCLPVDMYFLPHTSHYKHLHIIHYVDIFNYRENQYYIVSPYYHYKGWLDANVVHAGLFSPIALNPRFFFVPELKWNTLSAVQVYEMIQESCEYMLGQKIPNEFNGHDNQRLGLEGILLFSKYLEELTNVDFAESSTKLLELSAQVTAIGNSRYWLKRMISTSKPPALSSGLTSHLDKLFSMIIPSWRAVGLRFGAAIHAQEKNLMKQIVYRIIELEQQERQLFSYILRTLTDYDQGYL